MQTYKEAIDPYFDGADPMILRSAIFKLMRHSIAFPNAPTNLDYSPIVGKTGFQMRQLNSNDNEDYIYMPIKLHDRIKTDPGSRLK